MPNCRLYPERCSASVNYSKEKHKFKLERINDAIKTKSPIEQSYKNRKLSKEWKNIYPINNHDFNYNDYVLNKYNPFTLGITNTPSMAGLIDGTLNLSNYVDVMLEEPTPNSSTKSGLDDVNNADPTIYKHFKDIKNKYAKMPLPYPDFKKDYPESKYPTKGKASSSYFIKTGTCKSKIDNEQTCLKKGFTWVKNTLDLGKGVSSFFKKKPTTQPGDKNPNPKPIPNGICYKPKFIYIDNLPKGYLNLQGMAPAIINDVMNISPEKLLPILAGQKVDGGGLIPCKEEFVGKSLLKDKSLDIYLCINISILLLLIIIIKYFLI